MTKTRKKKSSRSVAEFSTLDDFLKAEGKTGRVSGDSDQRSSGLAGR
jgi:hypothetical protein